MFISRRVLAAGAVVVLAFFAGTTFARGGGGFSDVPPSHQFYDEIGWMADNGIAGGYPDGTYRPGAPVSRAAMAAFMSRLNSRYYVTALLTDPGAAASWTANASCDLGDRALMGAGRTTASNVFMTDSWRSDSNQGTWEVRWESENNVTIDLAQITVYVLCAPPALASQM